LNEYKIHPIYIPHERTQLDLTLNLRTEDPLCKPLKILIFGEEQRKKPLEYVRFEVFAAVLLKSWVLWDVTLCHWVN